MSDDRIDLATAFSRPQTTPEQWQRYSQYMWDDAEKRLQYQHEYTIAGLKTLVVINGGAIIGLLTYAGNASERVAAAQFETAFVLYVLGLAAATLAYLTAYLSQGSFMNFSAKEGLEANGMEAADKTPSETHTKHGNIAVGLGTLLALASLAMFVSGSITAARAITAPPAVAAPAKAAPPAKGR